jgi:hypothetical protein
MNEYDAFLTVPDGTIESRLKAGQLHVYQLAGGIVARMVYQGMDVQVHLFHIPGTG